MERPFLTVKQAHETLYHFHKPQTEQEANDWLCRYVEQYNRGPHRREPHSRIEDWVKNLPTGGLREMCSWQRFCTFAREPEHRKVGSDASIRIDGTIFDVDPDLAGETVTLWWGLFDRELFVEHADRRYGPYIPSSGPIPLHHFRPHRKTASEKRYDRISDLAVQIQVPRSAITGKALPQQSAEIIPLPRQAFVDPDPYNQFTYRSRVEALKAIADRLRQPLTKLDEADRVFVQALVRRTLDKGQIAEEIKARFGGAGRKPSGEGSTC